MNIEDKNKDLSIKQINVSIEKQPQPQMEVSKVSLELLDNMPDLLYIERVVVNDI